MDFTRQSPRAAEAHERFLVSGEKTCIDCHKGIAHHLPKVTAATTSDRSFATDRVSWTEDYTRSATAR